MYKNEFMHSLHQALLRQNTAGIGEILDDFEEHFAAGIKAGKTEEEISRSLGDPQSIAEQYPAQEISVPNPGSGSGSNIYTHIDQTLPGNNQFNTDPLSGNFASGAHQNPVRPNQYKEGRIVFLIFLNLLIVLPFLAALTGALVGIWSASAGVAAGAAALFITAMIQSGVHANILVLFGLSLTSLSILLFIASYYLSKAFVMGIIKYARWNASWSQGG